MKAVKGGLLFPLTGSTLMILLVIDDMMQHGLCFCLCEDVLSLTLVCKILKLNMLGFKSISDFQ